MTTEIYTKENCIFCTRAKEFFTKNSISYREYKLGVDFKPEELKSRLGVSPDQKITMPQIFVNNKSVGGYDDIVDKPGLFV